MGRETMGVGRGAAILVFVLGLLGMAWPTGAVDLSGAQSTFPRGTGGFPATVARADLRSDGTVPGALIPESYTMAASARVDFQGDGHPYEVIALQPKVTSDGTWLRRSAGILVYGRLPSGDLRLTWAFPPGWLDQTAGNSPVTWNQCEHLFVGDLTGEKHEDIALRLGFTGADYFGSDTFVLGYQRGRLVNLLPTRAPASPAGAARGPGKTALGQYGGGVVFRPAARPSPEIIVWGEIWGKEAKAAPHRYWGDIYRWNRGRYALIRRVQTKRKGEAGRQEIARVLGLTKQEPQPNG